MASDATALSVFVKYGKDQLQIELPASSRISDLLTEVTYASTGRIQSFPVPDRQLPDLSPPQLEARTGLIARKQKVMAKGKVVSQNPQATLAAAGITSGAKLMLLAAAGGATGGGSSAQPLQPSAGAAALAAAQLERAKALAARRAALGGGPPTSAAAAAAVVARPPPLQQRQGSMQQRAAAWAKTGIASVRDLGLAELPPELFDAAVAGSIRVLDAGGCRLTALPPSMAALSGLHRLRLAGSSLREDTLDWAALASLASLSALSLDRNQLAALPVQACALSTLRALSLSGNAELAALPPQVSRLASLRLLALAGCALAELPPQLGACSALEELDVRDNRLAALPPELARLPALRAILADRNRRARVGPGPGAAAPGPPALHSCCARGPCWCMPVLLPLTPGLTWHAPRRPPRCSIAAVPPALLADAPALCTLSLHGNPITAEALRGTPGFAEFDARRRAKYDKKIGMRLVRRHGRRGGKGAGAAGAQGCQGRRGGALQDAEAKMLPRSWQQCPHLCAPVPPPRQATTLDEGADSEMTEMWEHLK